MSGALKKAYETELAAAFGASAARDRDRAFHHLGRARILGQRHTLRHVRVTSDSGFPATMPASRRRAIFFALMMPFISLTACSPPPKFKSTDITGSSIGGDFELPTHDGRLRRLSDFRGKLVVVFFGFTNCPDVCPTTLYTLAQAMKALGAESLSVQVIMITADPARDTRQVLSQYVTSFDPRFIGLVPSEEALKQVAGMFKVFINRNQPNASGYYTVDHSTSSFVFDGEGRIRLLVPHTFSDQDWAADLRALLHKGGSG